MMKTIPCLLALAVTLTLSTAASAERYQRESGAPPPRHAEFGEPYLFGHIGLFEPDGDFNDYKSGTNFDFGVGSRVNENIAIEASLGRYAASRGGDDVVVWPLTFGARLILPQPVVEPYVGLGLGFYRANVDDSRLIPQLHDSDTTVGGYLSLGADAWLNPRTALNFEGRYQIANPSINDQNFDVGGWSLSLGLRVGF